MPPISTNVSFKQTDDHRTEVINYRWNPNTLAYEVETVSSGTGNDVNVTNASLAVTGPLTDTQLRATAVPVSFSGNVAQETGGNLATIKTDLDPLVTSTAGGYVRQDSTGTIAKESGGNLATIAGKDFATAANQSTGNTSLGTIKTNTDPLVTAGAGGYIRQDSTATMAKESGGNLATLAGKDFATSAKQDTGNTSLASIAGFNTAATATVTSVAGSATSVTLLALNTNRKGGTFYNDSTAILYLKFGTTASVSDYTVQLIAGAYYEIPQPIYTGRIDGIWASATGAVKITEET